MDEGAREKFETPNQKFLTQKATELANVPKNSEEVEKKTVLTIHTQIKLEFTIRIP